jgi:hybrid polyketide synthase/nonribosomal peptide synthetase ACE1
VDDIVQRHPDTIAIRETQEGRVWNYKQFGDRTAAVAGALLSANVTQGARVAVFQEPGFDWICSAMAVMRIGAVFVPFDVSTPVERLTAMVITAKPTVVLFHGPTASQEASLATIRDGCAQTIDVSLPFPSPVTGHEDHVPIMAKSREAAILYFTSGSTGVPKGVMLQHDGIPNFMEHTCDVNGPEVVLHHSALGFDLATWQVLTALAHGGTLVVVPRVLRGDAVAITALMAKEGVTCTGATPSEYTSWIQYGFPKLTQCKAWRRAMTGGEQCSPKLVEDFRTLQLPDLRLWNCYGPSEVTWGSNQAEIALTKPLEGVVTVGNTMPNRSVYILDDNLETVCVGMPGEVVIGGPGVGLGYLDNDALTAEKFIPDLSAPGTRMYRTGDRGRLAANGDLEILGRIDGDSQIKLRGIRIEMQDIEQTILRNANGALSNVCVTARGDPPSLVAHAVFGPDFSSQEQEQVAFLQRLATSLPLPQYMRPAAIVSIPAMPLNLNGKLDRRAVQRMPTRAGDAAIEQRPTGSTPLGEQELQLRHIWKHVIPGDVFALYAVNRDTDFFHVGGNSMLLVKLQDLIKREFGVTLTIMSLFEKSTLGTMAAAVHDATIASADAAIDWEEETALSKDVIDGAWPSSEKAARRPKPAIDGKIIILTGATGFIGRELLAQLISSSAISKVYCIAVRDPSKLADLESNPKVSIHAGDLSSLDDVDEHLFSAAHAVIHCGADVSFLKTYATLRRANVASTKALARLALKHGVDFHYISTIATGRLLLADRSSAAEDVRPQTATAAQDIFREQSLADHPPPPGWLDNYVASKWASEVFLERAAARLGLKAWVHRPSSVTGAGAGEMDVMSSVMRYAKSLRAVPASARWRGALDFVGVQAVADGVVNAVIKGWDGGKQEPEGSMKFLHHSGDVVIPIDVLKEYLEKEDAVEYKKVQLGEWIEMAVSEGLNVLVAAYLASVDEMDLDIVFQSYVKGGIVASVEE